MANEDDGNDGNDGLDIHIDASGFINPPGKSKPKYHVAPGLKVKFKLKSDVTGATVEFTDGTPFTGVSSIRLSKTSPSRILTAATMGRFPMTVTIGSELAGLSGTLDVDSKPEED
jgi:hypothetical protein